VASIGAATLDSLFAMLPLPEKWDGVRIDETKEKRREERRRNRQRKEE
jgi:hypothetical protein